MWLAALSCLFAMLPQDEAAAPPSRRIGEHTKPIQQLALSPEGEVLVTAAIGEVQAWDVKKDALRWKSTFADLGVAALGVGEELVAFHHGMAAVVLLELEEGGKRSGIGGTTAMLESHCIAVDPKDRWIWIGTDKGVMTRVVPGSVNAWSNRNVENGGVTALAMDAGGKTLAVGGRDGTIRFLGAQSANVDDKKVIEAHEAPVSALACDAKGALLCSGSETGALRTWKASSGKLQHELKASGASITRIALDARASLLATGDAEGVVELWDTKKGERLFALPAEKGAITGLAFVGKGPSLAVATSSDTELRLWDLSEL